MEQVGDQDFDEWREEKPSGLGRDPRVFSVLREVWRSRYMSTREGMQHITFLEVDEAPRDWPFKGPPAIREVLMAARTAREEFAGFHDFWIWASGAKPDSPVAIKRWDLLAVLRHALSTS